MSILANKSFTVMQRAGAAVVYAAGSATPLSSFGGGELPVDEIFAA